MFYQIFLSPQVKQCAIITYKRGICELPNELPKEFPNAPRITVDPRSREQPKKAPKADYTH